MAQHIVLLESGTKEFIALINNIEERLIDDVRTAIANAIADHFDTLLYGESIDVDQVKRWIISSYIDDFFTVTDEDNNEHKIIVERGFIY